MNLLGKLALRLNGWTARWVPSAFSIAVLLTLVTLVLGVSLTPNSLLQCIGFWGDGFWELLSFGMQMTLIMVTGYIVVVSPPMSRLLRAFAGLPRSATAAIAFTACGSMLLAWVNWGLGIIGSAMLVRFMAQRHRDADYRLLVAVSYFGLGCTWHAGLSASAPVLTATPGHFMEKQIGIIPLSHTIFHPFNLTATACVVVLMTAIAWWLHPRDVALRTRVDVEKLDSMGSFQPPEIPGKRRTFAEALDYGYLLNACVGLLGAVFLFLHFQKQGWSGVTINIVNFSFLILGILLHPSPMSVLKAAGESAHTIYNIVLQFPFYSGMYGIIKGTGLSDVIGDAFVSVASGKTLPLLVYWYSGIVNYFVPSGGSKWAVEAPYVIDAARKLGVGYDSIVVSYAWGDMMTDLLQPFWAIPLLTAAGLEFKEILGYEMIAFLFYAVVVSLFFYFLPFY